MKRVRSRKVCLALKEEKRDDEMLHATRRSSSVLLDDAEECAQKPDQGIHVSSSTNKNMEVEEEGSHACVLVFVKC